MSNLSNFCLTLDHTKIFYFVSYMFIVKNMRAFGEEIPILSCNWHIFSGRKDENLFLEKF